MASRHCFHVIPLSGRLNVLQSVNVSTKALQIVLITINDTHKKQTLYFI